LIAIYLANKIRHLNPASLVADYIMSNIACFAVDPKVILYITVVVCITAITIVSLLKEYSVDIDIDLNTRIVKIKYRK
jgi:hypothetical protein